MRILIISDEVWNDEIQGNNVLSNWFEGFNAEFANIYCSPGIPYNKSCKNYYQITDKMMLKSLFFGRKAGKKFKITKKLNESTKIDVENENRNLYLKLKAITTETIRLARELVWYFGRYDLESLNKFIEEFEPDIIFSPRKATIKILKLEKHIKEISKKPFVVFTGDDESSLKQLRFSPVFWVRRLMIRKLLKSNMDFYDLYYTHSRVQAEEYSKKYNVPTKILYKSGKFNSKEINMKINRPIKIVYAGKLYCNRWKVLALIGDALRKINGDYAKIILEIYTRDFLSKRQIKKLNDNNSIFLRGAVSPFELQSIYDNSDIALHVESFDLKNKLLTQYSFSTKIIDCLSSGCAVMAIAWNEHSGYKYLKKEDAAIVISEKAKIKTTLEQIVKNPEDILKYREKAWECGIKNHNIENVQQDLYNDFLRIIKKGNHSLGETTE